MSRLAIVDLSLFRSMKEEQKHNFNDIFQEYQYVQDELRRQHVEVQSKLHEKDAEIARLLNQVRKE